MVQRPIRGSNRQPGRWIGRIAALALIALVAASLPAPVQTALAATAVEAETELETLRFGRGDSLSLLLSRAGVRAVDADRISKAIQKRTNLRRISVGREVRLLFRADGEGRRVPVAISVETGKNRYVEATRGEKGRYAAHRTRVPLTRPVPLSEVVLGHDGQKVTVRRNDTLGGILHRHGVDGATVDAIARGLRGSFDPRDLMPGHAVTIVAGRDAGGAPVLNAIALHLDDDKAVAVVRGESGRFAAQRTTSTALPTMALAPRPPKATTAGDTATSPRHHGARARIEANDGGRPCDAAAGNRWPRLPRPPLRDADQPPAADEAYEGPEHPVEPELVELRSTLRSGSTLMDLLLDADVRRPEADAPGAEPAPACSIPRRLPAGITVRVMKRPVPGFEPRIAWLDIELPKGRRILVEREEKGRFSSRITNQPPPTPAQPAPAARGGRRSHGGPRRQRSRSERRAGCGGGSATVGHTRHGTRGRYPDGHPETARDRPRGGGSRHSGRPRAVQPETAQDRPGNHAGDRYRRDGRGHPQGDRSARRRQPLRQGFPRRRQPLRGRAGGPARVRGGPRSSGMPRRTPPRMSCCAPTGRPCRTAGT